MLCGGGSRCVNQKQQMDRQEKKQIKCKNEQQYGVYRIPSGLMTVQYIERTTMDSIG